MEPLHFLSGTFRGSQLRWATPDKEGSDIVEAVESLGRAFFEVDK